MLPQRFSQSDSIRIGVLLAPPPVQLLDLAPVDLFHMLSEEYLQNLKFLPQTIRARAVQSVKIIYIADADPSASSIADATSSVPLTADAKINISSTLTSPDVQPGQLTLLLIPGPDPDTVTPDNYREFIMAHSQSKTTDIITICTGIFPACYSGICDGRLVTAPRFLLQDLRTKFSGVREFEDKRWSRSSFGPDQSKLETGQRVAELWTAGGITNGHDCVAAYLKEHFDHDLAEIICKMADIDDRGREYGTSQLGEGAWWMSRIIRSMIRGLWK